MSAAKVLVIGSGSAGRRHGRNFSALGCEVAAVDPREDRRAELASEIGDLVLSTDDLEHALEADFDLVVVASPPSSHVAQAIAALDAGAHVLIEKPMGLNLESVRPLLEHRSRDRVLLGYTYRWWPLIEELRRLLDRGAIGEPLSMRCVMAAHLGDWHPWERYQDFFMARRELGGGALLDESHVIDLAVWLFGVPTEVWGIAERVGDLEIDSDDSVDSWWVAPSGPRVSIHLDLYSRPHRRTIEIMGSDGSIEWSFAPHGLTLHRTGEPAVVSNPDIDRNEMFIELAREAMALLRGTAPSCSVVDGAVVLSVVDAIRASGGRNVQSVAQVHV